MLEIKTIFKTYDGKPLINGISFNAGAGETICLLGASGSGKSTLLRIIAGLELPDSGIISFNGLDLTTTAPHLRDFGLVFQDYALFPHLNVNDNVAFGLKMRRMGQDEISQRVATSLEMVNLSGFEKRNVTDLSGGEQQRVALARALATRPRLLMFDEPLGALDRALREDLLNELRRILHQTNIPAIYVTHDQEEAFTIADRVLILHDGNIIREGTPSDVWANPESVSVAGFLGLGNVIEGEVIRMNASREGGTMKVKTLYGLFDVPCLHKHSKGDKVHLLARPFSAENNRVSSALAWSRYAQRTQATRPTLAPLNANTLHGVVADVIFQQDRFKVTLDNDLYVYLKDAPKIGKRIAVKVKVECLA